MKRWSALAGMLLLAGSLALSGCAKSSPSSAGTAAAGTAKGGDPQVQHVRRGAEKQEVQNDFRQIALQLQQFESERGKPPASVDEFRQYAKSSLTPSGYRGLAEGVFVFVPRQRGAAGIVVYEKEKDLNGNRVVLMTDGSVQTLGEPDFEKALKNK